MNPSTARPRPLVRAHLRAAGAAPGSIIAAIMGTHSAMKNANEPSRVAVPISMPCICQTETPQHAAATASVVVSAAAPAAVTRRGGLYWLTFLCLARAWRAGVWRTENWGGEKRRAENRRGGWLARRWPARPPAAQAR